MNGQLRAYNLYRRKDQKPLEFIDLGTVQELPTSVGIPEECKSWKEVRLAVFWEDGTAHDFYKNEWKPCVNHPDYGILFDGPIVGEYYINKSGNTVRNPDIRNGAMRPV